jgi:hypothetical protein
LIRNVTDAVSSLGFVDVTYTPRSGSPRTVQAQVDYEGHEDFAPFVTAPRPEVLVTVANNTTTGISSAEIDRGGDKLSVPPRYGRGSVTVRIVEIAHQDDSSLLLRCR